MREGFWRFFYLFLICFYILSFAKGINLTNSDLGRHLKNGEIILTTFNVPSCNLYSYTHPDFPFYIHHWLSGVVFYMVHSIFGFKGLSIFYITILTAAFLIFLNTSLRYSNRFVVYALFLLAVPLISNRAEIRPEGFSYLFLSIYFSILVDFLNNKIPPKRLYLLILLQFLWVNLHIYFIFGIFVIFVFLFEMIGRYLLMRFKKQDVSKAFVVRIKQISFVSLLCVVVSFLNPYGFKGMLFPFEIFKNYGYLVFENQSVWFIERLFRYPLGSNFKLLLILTSLSWVFVVYKSIRKKKDFPFSFFLLSLTFAYLAAKAVRNFAVFGFLETAIASINFKEVFKGKRLKWWFCLVVSLVLLYLLYWINPYSFPNKSSLGIGLIWGNDRSARFFIENNLKGPIFNNYDIGSYLIYYLYPKEKVWVDNRPEAYPASFFKEIYIPMQESEDIWEEMDRRYDFNVIFFYRHDATPWGQNFLIKRVFDEKWACVFVDENAIILVKRKKENEDVIKRFELPKEIFRVVKTK